MNRNRTILVALLIAAAGGTIWWRGRENWPIANAPPRRGIVCFGDSLTTGVGVAPNQVYHALLPGLLGVPRDQITARGRNGRTLAQARGHIWADVLSGDAGTVIVLLGGNDQLQVRSAESAMGDVDAIVRELVAADRMVVLCDFSPIAGIHRSWAKGFREIARRHGAVLVVGAADGLYGPASDTTGSDSIHLNAEGHRALAERIAEAMRPHLTAPP